MPINGLNASIPGLDVLKLVKARALERRQRAGVYEQQIQTLKDADIDMGTASNDVKARATENAKSCRQEAEHMDFMAKYIDVDEVYILSQYDLQKLGVVK